MPIRYKLTDADGYTRRGQSGETRWDEYVPTRVTDGEGDLCGASWTHVYTHPLLAEFLDPIHGKYGPNARLISVNVSGKCKKDRGLKEGWTKVSFRSMETRPNVSLTQKIAFGILCALQVYKDEKFQKWAADWLSGKNRTHTAANAANAASAANAANAANAAAYAAYAANAANTANAANAFNAANAAYAATHAAANAANTANTANAAHAAAYAATATDYAANAATAAAINLIKIAHQAMGIK